MGVGWCKSYTCSGDSSGEKGGIGRMVELGGVRELSGVDDKLHKNSFISHLGIKEHIWCGLGY